MVYKYTVYLENEVMSQEHVTFIFFIFFYPVCWNGISDCDFVNLRANM